MVGQRQGWLQAERLTERHLRQVQAVRCLGEQEQRLPQRQVMLGVLRVQLHGATEVRFRFLIAHQRLQDCTAAGP